MLVCVCCCDFCSSPAVAQQQPPHVVVDNLQNRTAADYDENVFNSTHFTVVNLRQQRINWKSTATVLHSNNTVLEFKQAPPALPCNLLLVKQLKVRCVVDKTGALGKEGTAAGES